MFTRRIDDFGGNDLAYVGYLYSTVTNVPVAELISQLEEQVARSRRVQPQAPSHPSGPSLNVEIWNPTCEYKPAQSRPASGAWERRTARFFRNLPVSEEQWCQKRQNAQLSTADDVLRTVDCLVTGSLDPLKDDKCSSAERSASLVAAGDQDSEDALSSSAERAAALIATAEHSKHVAQFFSLVFMAECRVAIFTGCAEASVYNAIRKFVEASGGKCNGDKTPALLLSTTLWVLQEQQRQFRRGLLHRGFELFFNEGRSLRFYTDCPKEPIPNARFTAKFPTCDVPDEIHASLPLWLPFIVAIRNVNQYSYTTICTALEVTLWSREEDFRKWRETYLSRTLVICHLEVDCPESQLPRKPRKLRHHARKRKRSPKPESQTLRQDSIQGTQFRATGAGQHGEPTVSRHDKSLAIRDSSALEREAETAPHSSLEQQVTPGVDLAGDVSARTATAPHNSPAVPVESESGGESGQAVSAGPPGCDVGVHSQDVPLLELLAVAAAQVDGDAFNGEGTAGENPEHKSGQRAGAPVGLSLDAAVGIAASPLQPYLSARYQMDQPRSEESLGEVVMKEGMTTITRPQLLADGTSLPTTETSHLGLAPVGDGVGGDVGLLQANGGTPEQGDVGFIWPLSEDQWETFFMAAFGTNTWDLDYGMDPMEEPQ